jgi:hypothetical protein
MPFTTVPAAGAKLRASVLSSLIVEVRQLQAVKTADEPAITSGTTGTTLQNDDHLFVALEASTNYSFILDVLYITPAAADIKFGWTYPSGLTMAWGGIAYNTAEVLTAFGGLVETTAPGFGGGAGDLAATLFGDIFVGSTPGTLQLQSAQFTANAGNTITRKGSSLKLWKT